TSGNSPNVLKGVEAAKACGLTTIGWTGGNGGKLASLAELSFVVPSAVTARIQEFPITMGHVLCELIEDHLLGKASLSHTTTPQPPQPDTADRRRGTEDLPAEKAAEQGSRV